MGEVYIHVFVRKSGKCCYRRQLRNVCHERNIAFYISETFRYTEFIIKIF